MKSWGEVRRRHIVTNGDTLCGVSSMGHDLPLGQALEVHSAAELERWVACPECRACALPEPAYAAHAALVAAAPGMLEALMAVQLHLMVRPENRLPEADRNVADMVSDAIAKANGAPP